MWSCCLPAAGPPPGPGRLWRAMGVERAPASPALPVARGTWRSQRPARCPTRCPCHLPICPRAFLHGWLQLCLLVSEITNDLYRGQQRLRHTFLCVYDGPVLRPLRGQRLGTGPVRVRAHVVLSLWSWSLKHEGDWAQRVGPPGAGDGGSGSQPAFGLKVR